MKLYEDRGIVPNVWPIEDPAMTKYKYASASEVRRLEKHAK